MISLSKKAFLGIMSIFTLALFVGCSDDDSTSDCTPGSTQVCLCPGGGSGVQTCEADKTWGSCEDCESTECTPGESQTCQCSGGGTGTQYCGTDGAWGSCEGCENGETCGNNVREGSEVCDGTDLAGETCISQGFESGTLACLADCSGFDTSSCSTPTIECGNDIAEPGEVCDGTDLAGETCLSQGYDSGTLACLSDCSGFDTSGCLTVPPFTWITITGGTFDMGSNDGSSNELPVHSVTVPTFEITKTEVTVEQYEECVTAGECTAPSTYDSRCNWEDPGYEDHPVNCITWYKAREFCEWAGGRLPSEAEWEYAARSGGQDITYPWGNDTATCDYAVMNDGGNGCETDRTWPVCSKVAGNTDQGLCDMAGNVWEWVEDDYHSDYNGAPSDGSAWVGEPRDYYRVVRGGSFGSPADSLRAAFRSDGNPSGIVVIRGFRCARDAP